MAAAADLPLAESLREEYCGMVARLERTRARAQKLRALADQAGEQVVAEEQLLKSLAELLDISPQATIDQLGGALRGQRLREVAVEILAQHHVPGDEVHYRAWYKLVTAAGVAVAGKDPVATFLSQVSRSDAVEPVGRRSGRYRLRVAA